MRDYIILNGVNSNTITGLLISTLPPITKPKIRTQTEEIDGRDGDIVTKLGYSAYDKELEIGLYGDFDIDDVIAYFNSEGTVTFSNEPDKFYNYQILDQIDYEKLIRFKKAKVKMHVQPFKYPLEETPVEITNQYVNNEAEEMDLDNTKEAPMTIALKGNTSQNTTTGKNLLSPNFSDYTLSTGNYGYIQVTEEAESLYLSIYEKDSSIDISGVYLGFTGNGINSGEGINWILNGASTPVATQIGNTNNKYKYISFYPKNEATFNKIFSRYNVMVRKQSITDNTFEPYTNGASPNPDYPQEISVVSGDNEIKVVGKNLWSLGNMSFTGWAIGSNDIKNLLNSLEIGTYTITLKAKVKTITNPQTTYRWGIYSSGTGFALDVRNNLTQTLQVGDIITNQVTFPINNNNKGKFVNAYTYTISSTSGVVAGTVELFETQLEKNNQATEYQEYKGATYPISLGGKNLFNKDNADVGHFINASGYIGTDATGLVSDYIEITPNTNYYISGRTLWNSIGLFNSSKTFIERINLNYVNGIVNISNSNVKYIRVNASLGDLNTLQLEKGSTATTYEPYNPNPIELCKIGDYQDRIYKDSGKWYIEKQIGKVILDGSESWNINTAWNYTNTNLFILTNTDVHTTRKVLSNNFFYYSSAYANDINGEVGQVWANTLAFRISNTLASDVAGFKTWLGTHNTIVYYILETPTTTEITDETLIAQLEALKNASSYDTKTHITQNSNDKPFILNATALQQGSGEATVNNEGNIYSKPTLDIEGSGTIGIYLDGNQMFSVDLNNATECIIDTAKLEAYDPSTSELMNRQVTGDYSNFKLNAGENQVSTTGEIEKVTISNYTRWL